MFLEVKSTEVGLGVVVRGREGSRMNPGFWHECG